MGVKGSGRKVYIKRDYSFLKSLLDQVLREMKFSFSCNYC